MPMPRSTLWPMMRRPMKSKSQAMDGPSHWKGHTDVGHIRTTPIYKRDLKLQANLAPPQLSLVGGEPDIEGFHLEIPLSSTEQRIFMPPHLATSKESLDEPTPQDRFYKDKVAQLERSSDHSILVPLYEDLDKTRAPTKEFQERGPLVMDNGVELLVKIIALPLMSLLDSSSPRSLPPRDPTFLHNLGKRQLLEEEGETEKEDREQEDDSEMVPEEAAHIRNAKLETLIDQRT
ncbi:hypothetical protein HAX54_045969 [Datura stramonium]|uniref:Uncharacterized protein n=1 Tax=Datura stramonium TaxID=4076 RepID=A0ABS8WGC4_DATST|nr:hypothetical protein [Datura stramonium]